jgi:hypothetical protein
MGRTIRYETEAMSLVRKQLNEAGWNDEDVDTFKHCLAALERKGFSLRGPDTNR